MANNNSKPRAIKVVRFVLLATVRRYTPDEQEPSPGPGFGRTVRALGQAYFGTAEDCAEKSRCSPAYSLDGLLWRKGLI